MSHDAIGRWGIAAAVALGLLAVACSSDDEALPGIGYRVPGQATSARLLPLTVPPDFGLRPEPADETPEGYEIVSTQEDEAGLQGGGTITQGEEIILARSGAVDANPDIRKLLNQDNAIFVGNPIFVDDLLYGSHPEGGDVTLEEGGDIADDVVIREGGRESEDDFDFLNIWF